MGRVIVGPQVTVGLRGVKGGVLLRSDACIRPPRLLWLLLLTGCGSGLGLDSGSDCSVRDDVTANLDTAAEGRAVALHFDAQGARLEHGPFALHVSTGLVARGVTAPEQRQAAALPEAAVFPPLGPAAGAPALSRAPQSGVVEYWAEAPTGFEQAWSVGRRPAGEGPLSVHLETPGTRWHTDSGDALIGSGEDGGLWRISGVHALDANGRALRAAVWPAAAGYRIELDDDGAVAPILIDPVYSTAGVTVADVTSLDDEPCDLDGDGFGDLIASRTGIVRVSFGHPDGIDPSRDRVFAGDSGWCLGDYTGDGLDDLGVQAGSRADGYQLDVYAGSLVGLAAGTYASLYPRSSTMETYFGNSVVAGGDYDGDGRVEILVSAGGTGGETVYWFERSSTSRDLGYDYPAAARGDFDGDGLADYILRTAPSSPSFTVVTRTGASPLYYGSPVGAGDMNADGFSDLVVSSSSSLQVYFGGVTGLASSPTRTYSHSTAVVADFNGDGYDDVVGSSSSSTTGSLYLGGPTGTSSVSAGTVPTGLVGQLDGDAAAEVVTVESSGSYSRGRVRVYYAPVTAPTSIALTLTGREPVYVSGRTIAHDLNGDGLGELIVARSGYDYALDVYLSFVDADGDGVAVGEDCDDLDAAVGAASVPLFEDGDGDGFGDLAAGTGCSAGSGFAAVDGDCDDDDPGAFPGAAEPAGVGEDRDCDGVVWCYVDLDADGFSDGLSAVPSADGDCADPGESTGAGRPDCDDTDDRRSPVAVEVCDGVDNDCDGLVDDDDILPPRVGASWWPDADGDGYGAGPVSQACSAPLGMVLVDIADCDDGDGTISPAGGEVCDGRDNDCDGLTDDADPGVDPATRTAWFTDTDGDGFGGGAAFAACTASLGTVSTAGDCDDSSAAVSPGRPEAPGDGVDGDCDGREFCFDDLDGDGHRGASLVAISGVDCAAAALLDASAPPDCPGADGDPRVYPTAVELPGDALDADCDGLELCFADHDGDGEAAVAGVTVLSSDLSCSAFGMADATAPQTDCDDGRGDVGASAPETPADGVDGDCDGFELCYVDADGDGYAAEGLPTVPSRDARCAGAGVTGAPGPALDCDDGAPLVYPLAEEVPDDGVDQDCDGEDEVSGSVDGSGDDAGADGAVADDGGGDGSAADGASDGDGPADSGGDNGDPGVGVDDVGGADGVGDSEVAAEAGGGDGKGSGGCAHSGRGSTAGWLVAAVALVVGAARRRLGTRLR